jgi:glycosyltransferase involved in cell wall biosynthesis
MAKLSVIIPARNEKYLIPTVEDIFKNARGEVEAIAVLEGYVPDGWRDIVAKYPLLHTIQHHEAKGMRASINEGAASAISRGAKYLAKFDAHCCFGEGFDEIIKADMDKDWIVVPRRKRLDPETFAPRDDGRLDIDYHYLTFPDNVKDFGGPGLNGRVWDERARERLGKPEYDIDDELTSQGSGWATTIEHFKNIELMDSEHYGQFWNESQEWSFKTWLSGGRVVVNKKTHYAHWHKGSAGRGYHLDKSWLSTGATFTKNWMFNSAWPKQTMPFSWLVEKFWPIPGWPENWRELLWPNGQEPW